MDIYLITHRSTYKYTEDEYVRFNNLAYLIADDLVVNLDELGVVEYSMQLGFHVYSIDKNLIKSYQQDIRDRV